VERSQPGTVFWLGRRSESVAASPLDLKDAVGSAGGRLMRLSARNQIPGTVKKVTQGQVMAEVVVEVTGGHELVAAITAESVRALGLAPGKRVFAVVKSTEVMIGVDD
jgi:molybdopterin-binding protein